MGDCFFLENFGICGKRLTSYLFFHFEYEYYSELELFFNVELKPNNKAQIRGDLSETQNRGSITQTFSKKSYKFRGRTYCL